MAAHARLETFFAIDAGIAGRPADGADVDVEEAVQHVAGAAGVVEGNHVARIVEEDVGEVTRFLVYTRRLAFKGPVPPWGNSSGGDFKPLAAVPFHIVDEGFGAEVVTDEVFLAGEEENREFFEEVWEERNGRRGVAGTESAANSTGAFGPAAMFVVVDVEGVDDVFPSEIGRYVFEVRGPVHSAAGVDIIEADVVHVHAAVLLGGQAEDVLKDCFAVGVVDMGVFTVGFKVAGALSLGGFDLLGDWGILCEHTSFIGVFEVGI